MRPQLTLELLEVLSALWERAWEVSNDAERDLFGESCPNCDGAVPMAHSLGCRVKNALHRARKWQAFQERLRAVVAEGQP